MLTYRNQCKFFLLVSITCFALAILLPMAVYKFAPGVTLSPEIYNIFGYVGVIGTITFLLARTFASKPKADVNPTA